MKKTFLGCSLLIFMYAYSQEASKDTKAEMKPLFNGMNLEGWQFPANKRRKQ